MDIEIKREEEWCKVGGGEEGGCEEEYFKSRAGGRLCSCERFLLGGEGKQFDYLPC